MPKNISFFPLGPRRGDPLREFALSALPIRRIMRKIRPDIVHGHYLLEGGIHAAVSGIRPLIQTAWGTDVLIAPHARRMNRYFARVALERADLITCDAAHMAGAIRKLAPRVKRIERINFGTDTERFQPDKRVVPQRAEWGAAPETVIVISTRNFSPVYSVETLVRAVPIVMEQCRHVKFVIAGDGEQKNHLRTLVKDLGVSANVHFAGSLSGDDMPRHLASADIYVSTSLSDGGLAASTAEAMACGLPVIVTAFGDNEEWVKHEENGLVIQTERPDILADAIVSLARNPEQRARFGKLNRTAIEEKSDYEKEMMKMESLYISLLAAR